MNKLLCLFAGLLFSGCYLFQPNPTVLIKKDFNSGNIAVLNFSRQGNNLSNDIGKIAADKLTDALFLVGHFSVIDRSKVNEAQAKLDISSTEFLSQDQIQQIGLKLKADYLILGRVQQVSDKEYINLNSDNELYLSFRIVSVVSSDVLGIATLSESYEHNVIEKLDLMIGKIVTKIIKN